MTYYNILYYYYFILDIILQDAIFIHNILQQNIFYMFYTSKYFLLQTFYRIQFFDFLEPFLSVKPLSIPNNWRCSVSCFAKGRITTRQ